MYGTLLLYSCITCLPTIFMNQNVTFLIVFGIILLSFRINVALSHAVVEKSYKKFTKLEVMKLFHETKLPQI